MIIIDPITLNKLNINSKLGINILRKYINYYNLIGGRKRKLKKKKNKKKKIKDKRKTKKLPLPNNKNIWTIYFLPQCPYCLRAIDILKKRREKVTYINVIKLNIKDKIKKKLGQNTFPIIYKKNKKIGGMDNLIEYLTNSTIIELISSLMGKKFDYLLEIYPNDWEERILYLYKNNGNSINKVANIIFKNKNHKGLDKIKNKILMDEGLIN